MARNNLVGAWGEAAAADYLRKKHYTLVASGFRCKFGEVDLIARKGKYLIFAEVKTRKDNRFAEAREFVDEHKRQRLRSTAAFYLAEHPTRLQPRFDVIEVYAPEGTATANPEIHHLEDAFS